MSSKTGPQYILIASASKDFYGTRLVHPATGNNVWSFKGVEIQNAEPSVITPVGEKGEQLLVAIKDQPLMHLIGMCPKKRLHVKSILPKPVTALVTDQTGSFIFGALGNAVYTWAAATRELISVSEVQYLDITAIAVSPDNAYVVVGAQDGSISVNLRTDLIAQKLPGVAAPNLFHTYSVHSREVNGISITASREPRILSVDSANTAVIYSLASKAVLFRCSDDYALTSCCFSSNEGRFFLGNQVGAVTAISLTKRTLAREEHINTSEPNGPCLRYPNKHSAAVTRMDTSFDDATLVSADESGVYVIWNVSNASALHTGAIKAAILTARFVPAWESIFDQNFEPPKMETLPFHKQPTNTPIDLPMKRSVLPLEELKAKVNVDFKTYLARAVANYKATGDTVPPPVSGSAPTVNGTAYENQTSSAGPDIPLADHTALTDRIRELEAENTDLNARVIELHEIALSALITEDE
uniref:WD_REPEATS_REGION domain-containing protein n=1 Tax=Panagrellus redivivus TaxID=6233 RepID=A0A7E4ZU88_PANRE